MQASAASSPRESFVPLHADSLHDLASPVNQLSTMLELYLRRQRGGEVEQDPLLGLIREAAGRLQRFISAMQEYDRVTSAPPKIRVCDANTLAGIAVNTLDVAIRESTAEVSHDALPEIECDPGQMACVFTALIDNGIKFRGGLPSRVRVSAARQGDEWLFSVRDNGIGIDQRHHQAVFHLFKRINGDRYPGCGAGLAIASRVIEQHGGRIWVESELGQGSDFLFTLPFRPLVPGLHV